MTLYFYSIDSFVKAANKKETAGTVVYLPFVPLWLTLQKGGEERAELENALKICKSMHNAPEIVVSLPYIMRGNGAELFKKGFDMLCDIAGGFLVQNIGDVELLCTLGAKERGKTVRGDYSLNVMNSGTAEYFFKNWGLTSAAILPELTVEEQIDLAKKFPEGMKAEICLGDNIIVMRSEHCFAAEKEGFHCKLCGSCGTDAAPIYDTSGRIYPIICNPLDCNSVLLAPRKELSKPNLLALGRKLEAEHPNLMCRVSFL